MGSWSEAIIGLLGVLVGSAVTTVGMVWTQRMQMRASLAAEERAREISASTAALSALSQLLQMPDEPSGEDDWHRQREAFLLLLGVAAQDLGSPDLRDRLAEVHFVLEHHVAAASMTGRLEARTRTIACGHALSCLGAFRRGEPIPERPADYVDTVEAIDEWYARRTSDPAALPR
jgi:hypothetical protein